MDRRSPRAGLAVLASAIFVLAGCGGGDDKRPRKLVPGIEVVNASRRQVYVHWFPKLDEESRGTVVVPGCTDRLIPIPRGNYSLTVGVPGTTPARLGWHVTPQARCCLRVRRDGRIVEAPGRPRPPLC